MKIISISFLLERILLRVDLTDRRNNVPSRGFGDDQGVKKELGYGAQLM